MNHNVFQLTESDRRKVEQLLTKMQKWFENWFLGTVPIESITEYQEFVHPEWRLVNKEIPNQIATKSDFFNIWPQFHGTRANSDFKQYSEIISVERLSPEYIIVLSKEFTEENGELRTRPMTILLHENPETKELLFYHVHE
jgi:hypothetical protein